MMLNTGQIRAMRAWPSDTEAMLSEAEAAGLLPEDIQTARDYLEEARKLSAAGNTIAAMWACRAAWERAHWLHNGASEKKEIRAGRASVGAHRKSNVQKASKSDAQRQAWQKLANEKWAEPQHANKSASDIAKLIAGPGENPETVRRRIKKLA